MSRCRAFLRKLALALLLTVPGAAGAQYTIVEIAGPGNAPAGQRYQVFSLPAIAPDGEVGFTAQVVVDGVGNANAVMLDDGLSGSPAVPILFDVGPADAACTALVADAALRDAVCLGYPISNYVWADNAPGVTVETISPVDGSVTDIINGDGTGGPVILLQESANAVFPDYVNDELQRGWYNSSGNAIAWMIDSAGECSFLVTGDGSLLSGAEIGVPPATPPFFNEVLDTCDMPAPEGITGNWDFFFPVLQAGLSQDGSTAVFSAQGSIGGRFINGLYAINTTGSPSLELVYEGDVFNDDNAPAVNDAGDILFLELVGGGAALSLADTRSPGEVTRIADTISGPYTSFLAWTMNASGQVLFTAYTNDAQGLYFYDPGTGSVTTIIDTTYLYDGGAVTAISLARGGLNDAGEFVAKLRAVPLGAPANDYLLKWTTNTGAPEIVVADDIGATDDLTIDFGRVFIGESVSATVTINNTGSADLDISQAGLVNPGQSAWSVDGSACQNTSIVPGGNCRISISFAPDSTFDFPNQVSILSNDSDEPDVRVTLLGSGGLVRLRVIEPDTADQDGQFDFGPYTAGTSTVRTFRLVNDGTEGVTIERYDGITPTIDAAFNGAFLEDMTVSAGGEGSFNVSFDPPAAGLHSGYVTVVYTANADPDNTEYTATVNLAGEGVAEANAFTVLDNLGPSNDYRLDFGNVPLDEVRRGRIEITNNNRATLDIRVDNLDPPAPPYEIVGNSCADLHLGLDESCLLQVDFLPTVTGLFEDRIGFNYGDINNPSTFDITLYGTGADAAVEVTDSIDPADDLLVGFGVLSVNETASAVVTVTNVTDADVALGVLGSGTVTVVDPVTIADDLCSEETLAPAASCTFLIDVNALMNAAPVEIDQQLAIPITGPNPAEVILSVTGSIVAARHDLAIEKVALHAANDTEITSIQPGETFRYRVTIENSGPDPAFDVVGRDILPTSVSVPDGMSASDTLYDPESGDWPVGDMDPGASATLEIPVVHDSSIQGCILNEAELVSGIEGDPNPLNNTASNIVTTQGCGGTDLEAVHIELTVPPATATDDEFTVSYRVVVRNNGPESVEDILVTFAAYPVGPYGFVSPCNETDIIYGASVERYTAWCKIGLDAGQEQELRLEGDTISAVGSDFDIDSRLQIGYPSPQLEPGSSLDNLFDSSRIDIDPENNELRSTDVVDRRSFTTTDNCPFPELFSGTRLEPYLDDVRDFRDEILMATAAGREFVDWYYDVSPNATAWLQDNEWSVPIVRAGLTPVMILIAFPLTSLQLLLGILGFRYRRQLARLVTRDKL